MARYSDIDEFRAALNGLVHSTGGARRNPGRRTVARRNMAMEYDGIKFDTLEELLAYKKAMGSAPRAAAPRRATSQVAAPQFPALPSGLAGRGYAPPPAPRKPRAPRSASAEMTNPDGPPTYRQAQAIGVSIGGLSAYCPKYAGQRIEGGAHRQALHEMGLTKAIADQVIDKLKSAGVFYGRTAEQHFVAREILAAHGITCPVPGHPNPRRSRRR